VLTIRHVDGDRVRHVDRHELGPTAPASGYWWVDIAEPEPHEEEVLELLGVHPMAIEDMREDRHLPKLEAYGDELSLTVHGLWVDHVAEEVDTSELDVSMRPWVLVTWHRAPIASVDAVGRRLDERGGAAGLDRPVLLLHRLLDTMNDVMVPFVDHLERRLDIIEEDLLSTPTEATRQDLYRLQRDVIQLRRSVVPQAEVIRRLGRESVGLIADEDRWLFRDVHDHLYRMAELSDSYRQLLDSAMTSYRSAQDDELNDMLRVLTLVSALLLPITMIAGIYGMNFEYMPELSWRPGYFVVLGGFVSIVLGMALWFRSRGWIGRAAEREAEQRRRALGSVLEIPLLGTVLKVPVSGVRAVARTGQRVVTRR
jgi:magnesium transporter